jgi:hypothetical protein
MSPFFCGCGILTVNSFSMFDITVQLHEDNYLIDINLLEHIRNKKVIICPCVKITQKPTLVYLGYLNSLIDTHGVDEIIIINSLQDKFFNVLIESYYPRIRTVTDESQTFIKSLKYLKNKEGHSEDLVQTWIFQQVVHDCKEIGFWEQPESNNWEELLQNKRAIQEIMKFGSWQRKIIQKFYKSRHNHDIWNVENYNIMRSNSGIEGMAFAGQMGANFWYFALFHNKELESSLDLINNRSGKTL